MKKLLFTILIASTALTGCYKDEGNYDYSFNTMNEITNVSFLPEAEEQLGGLTIEFTQPLNEKDTLQRVTVNLNQTLQANLDNLEYSWARSYYKNGVNIKDTTHTHGYMDVVLPLGEPITYNCMLKVYDKTTDLAHYTKFTVTTCPIFKNSTFILHGSPGSRMLGNVEKVGTNIHVHTDAYKVVYPQATNPFSDASRLMFQAITSFQGRNLIYLNNFIVFFDGREAKMYNPFGLVPRNENLRNFVLPTSDQGIPAVSRIGMVGDPSNQSDYYYIVAKDGRIVTARTQPSFKFPYAEEGETDYRITAATITNEDFIFWDSKHNRFLHVNKEDSYGPWAEDHAYGTQLSNPLLDANVDFSSLDAALRPEGKTAVYGYIQYRENFENEKPFFVFKDDNNNYYLYELAPIKESDEKKIKRKENKDDKESTEEVREPAYTVKAQRLEGFTPDDPQSIYYNTWFPSNYLFYIERNTIVKYNISNGEKQIIYTAPDGYSVACMKVREENTQQFSADLGLYIGIGLNKGSQGAFTEIKLTNAGDIDESYSFGLHSTDANGVPFGNIADIQFVHEYTYKISND